MFNLTDIINELLLEGYVNNSQIKDAIDNKYRVLINYNSHGENIATGWRIIEVFAYGLTKAGNPVIRAYQPYGDTSTRIPSWKFFRVDRIINWKKTGQYFNSPREKYNFNGDNTMSVMYYNASFDNDTNNLNNISNTNDIGPKVKNNELYKTNNEKEYSDKLNSLKKQLENPIYFKDLKNYKKSETGPKLKNDKYNLTNQDDNNIFNSEELNNKEDNNITNNG